MNTNRTAAEIAFFASMGVDITNVPRPAADVLAEEQVAAVEAATGLTVEFHGTPQGSVEVFIDIDRPFYGLTRSEAVAAMHAAYVA